MKMALIEWNEKDFSVDSPEMDGEHKKWINIINELHEALLGNIENMSIEKLFSELIDYTNYHFGHEERLLEEAGYPDLEAHKKLHRDFRMKIVKQKEDFSAGDVIVLRTQVMSELKSWLEYHIQSEDREYSEHLAPKAKLKAC